MGNKVIVSALGVLLIGLAARGVRAEPAKDEGAKAEKSEKADQAEPSGRAERDWGGGRREKAFKRLGLSDEQQARLKEHRQAHREKAKGLRESLRDHRDALRAELEKTELDEKAVRKAHERLKDADSKLADHRLEGILAVRRILTAEQFRKMTERKRRRRGRMGRWFGGRGEGPRDGQGE